MKRQASKPASDGRQAAAAALAAAAAGGARGGGSAAAPAADGGRGKERTGSFQRPSAAKHKPRQAPAHTPDRCGASGWAGWGGWDCVSPHGMAMQGCLGIPSATHPRPRAHPQQV